MITHEKWPGAPGSRPAVVLCKTCGAEFASLNPRAAKHCPVCRHAAKVASSQKSALKRKAAP